MYFPKLFLVIRGSWSEERRCLPLQRTQMPHTKFTPPFQSFIASIALAVSAGTCRTHFVQKIRAASQIRRQVRYNYSQSRLFSYEIMCHVNLFSKRPSTFKMATRHVICSTTDICGNVLEWCLTGLVEGEGRLCWKCR